MRLLIILIFLTVAKGFQFVVQNGILDVAEDGEDPNMIISKLTKSDGTNMSNIFLAKTNQFVDTSINKNPDDQTIVITRTVYDPNGELLDCFQLSDDTQWFGGPEFRHQYWPIQNMCYEEEAYLPTHPSNMAIAERYWLSSKGIYIYVDYASPLFLDQNNYRDKYLCMITKNKAPYQHRDIINVTYTIGVFPDPTTAHQYAVKNHLGKPTVLPDSLMVQYPIWSTWARYKTNITAKVVETYADEIVAHGFKNSQIEIDDNWETCYGSAEFDPVKFPDVSALTKLLNDKGFRVTLWIHPFINRNCESAYSTALNNDYFVKNLDGNVQMSWWQGSDAATIDFTNADAVNWWTERVWRLQGLGINSFKFDAGEVSWLPQVPKLTGPSELQPSIFTEAYVRKLTSNFPRNIEVRVGWRTQDLPTFVRMIDKDSRWTWDNGLPTLITTLLQMNLNGYVYVLPDMIGGNGYLNGSLDGTERPSRELFVRWLQATVFMPSMQYSFVPWDFDEEIINICRIYTELHENYTTEIVNAMQQAVEKGTPVNPPIWWIDPLNSVAHKIDDEYLLGESILVAPIIEEGAVNRNIYLPNGTWIDMNRGTTYEGPRWMEDYYAPLEVLPYFKRLST
ncbi:hypothetical protein ALC60_04020 [Trachymyrmex zeteki]|uniref:Family 31 glucosidase KIAA1161 n=2 Tax=Mycetomoellerius zeteki TaxID=64791 RepID=A0A151X9I8_9HYME|nr:hypothetical protein ALC60_04020 [Trachymyrmex zeteki]